MSAQWYYWPPHPNGLSQDKSGRDIGGGGEAQGHARPAEHQDNLQISFPGPYKLQTGAGASREPCPFRVWDRADDLGSQPCSGRLPDDEGRL